MLCAFAFILFPFVAHFGPFASYKVMGQFLHGFHDFLYRRVHSFGAVTDIGFFVRLGLDLGLGFNPFQFLDVFFKHEPTIILHVLQSIGIDMSYEFLSLSQ